MCGRYVVTNSVTKTNKLIIENINVVKRHKKPDQQNQSGGIINKEMPIDISNVKVIANG